MYLSHEHRGSIKSVGMRNFMILFLLTVCLQLIGMAHARRKRIQNFTPCSRKPMAGSPIIFGGCYSRKPIRAYGCQGYCESETLSMTDRKGLSTRCTCCKATVVKPIKYRILCRKYGVLKTTVISVISALQCGCQSCTTLMNRLS